MRKILFIMAIVLIYFSFNYGKTYFNYVLDLEIKNELQEETEKLKPTQPRWTDDTFDIKENQDELKPNFDDVVNQYEAQFDTLKNETLKHIEQLKTDVLSDLNSETNPLTLGMTILKYEKKAQQLENEIDQNFEKFFENYISRLHQLNYSTAPVQKLERQYERTKRSIKNELVQEANSWIEEQKRF